METRVPARLSPREGRRFGLTLGVAFVVLGGALWWRGHATTAPAVAALGSLLALAGLAAPTRLGPLERAWTRLAAALSKVTTPIFLGILYFGVLAPVGLVRRVAGRSPLVRAPVRSSFWIARHVAARRRRDMERLF